MAFSKEGAAVVGRVALPYDFSDIITKQAQTSALFRQNESREKQFEIQRQRSQNTFFKVLFQNKNGRHQLNKLNKKGQFDASQYHNLAHQNAMGKGPQVEDQDVIKGPFPQENVLKMLTGGQASSKAARAAEQKQLLDQEMAHMFETSRREEERQNELLKARKGDGTAEETERMKTMRLAHMLGDMDNDLAELDFKQFQTILDVPGVRKEVSYMLLDQLSKAGTQQKNQVGQLSANGRREVIDRCLSSYDKKLFLKLRNAELTIDQIGARLSAKHFGATYKVLDDLREQLNPDICKGFEDDGYFKRLYNKGLHEEVPLDEILKPRAEWLSNKHCRRSLIGKHGQRPRKTQSAARMDKYREPKDHEVKQRVEQRQTPIYDPDVCSAEKVAERVATRLSRTLSKEQRHILITTNDEQQEKLEKEILKQVPDSEHKAKTVDTIISKLQHKIRTQHFPNSTTSTSKSKSRQTGNSQVKERMQQEQALFSQLMFLKKLELDSQNPRDGDSGQIIWNTADKLMFDRLEAETVRARRMRLGLERSLTTDEEKEEEKKLRKPRPVEIIEEIKMIGKYGTQGYVKRARDGDGFAKVEPEDSIEEKQLTLKEAPANVDALDGFKQRLQQVGFGEFEQEALTSSFGPLLNNQEVWRSKPFFGTAGLEEGLGQLDFHDTNDDFRKMKEDLNSIDQFSQSFGLYCSPIKEYQAPIESRMTKRDKDQHTKNTVFAHSTNKTVEHARIQSNQNCVTTDLTLDTKKRIHEEDPKNDDTLSIDKPAGKTSGTRKKEDSIDNMEGYKVTDEGSLVLVANTTEMQLIAQSQSQNQDRMQTEEAQKHEESLDEMTQRSGRNSKHGSAGNNSRLKVVEQSSSSQQENATKSFQRHRSCDKQLNPMRPENCTKLDSGGTAVHPTSGNDILQPQQRSQGSMTMKKEDQSQVQTQNSQVKLQPNEEQVDGQSSTQSVNNLKSIGVLNKGQQQHGKLRNQSKGKGKYSISKKAINSKQTPKVKLMNLELALKAVKNSAADLPYRNGDQQTSLSPSRLDVDLVDNQTFGFQKIRSIQDRSNWQGKQQFNKSQVATWQSKFDEAEFAQKRDQDQEQEHIEVFKKTIDLNDFNEETMSYLHSADQQLFHKSDLKFIKETLTNLDAGGLLTIQSTNPTKLMHENSTRSRLAQFNTFSNSAKEASSCSKRKSEQKGAKGSDKLHTISGTGLPRNQKSSLPPTEADAIVKSAILPSDVATRILNPDGASCGMVETGSRGEMKSNMAHDDKRRESRSSIPLNQAKTQQQSHKRGHSAHHSSRSRADYHTDQLQSLQKTKEAPAHRSMRRLESISTKSDKNMLSNGQRRSNRILKAWSKRGSNEDIPADEYQMHFAWQLQQEEQTRSQMVLKTLPQAKQQSNWGTSRAHEMHARESLTNNRNAASSTHFSSQLMQLNYRAKQNKFGDGGNNMAQYTNAQMLAGTSSTANELMQTNCSRQMLNNGAPSSFINNDSMESLLKPIQHQSQATLHRDSEHRQLREVANSTAQSSAWVGRAFPHRTQALGPQRTQAVNLKKQHQRKMQTSNQIKRETLVYRTKIKAANATPQPAAAAPAKVSQGSGHSPRGHVIDLSQTNALQKRLNNMNSASDITSKFEDQEDKAEEQDSPSKFYLRSAVDAQKDAFNKTQQFKRRTQQLGSALHGKINSKTKQISQQPSKESARTSSKNYSEFKGHRAQTNTGEPRIVSATVKLKGISPRLNECQEGEPIRRKLRDGHQISKRLVGFLNQNQIPVKLTGTNEIRFVKSGRVTSQRRNKTLRSYRTITKGKEDKRNRTAKKIKPIAQTEEEADLGSTIAGSASRISTQVPRLNVLGSHYAINYTPDVAAKDEVSRLEDVVDQPENVRIIDNQFIAELVNPNLYITNQTDKKQSTFDSWGQDGMNFPLPASRSTEQLRGAEALNSTQKGGSALRIQGGEDSTHTMDSQADQYQTYMYAVNARFAEAHKLAPYGQEQTNGIEIANSAEFRDELKMKEVQLIKGGLSGNFARQQHFGDNNRMAAHLSHFRHIEGSKLKATQAGCPTTKAAEQHADLPLQHLQTLQVTDFPDMSDPKHHVVETTISVEQEQAESETAAPKCRPTLELEKSHSTRKSIVIKSNRNRVQSALPCGSAIPREDLDDQQPASDAPEACHDSSTNKLDEDKAPVEAKRSSTLLSVISKKSEVLRPNAPEKSSNQKNASRQSIAKASEPENGDLELKALAKSTK